MRGPRRNTGTRCPSPVHSIRRIMSPYFAVAWPWACDDRMAGTQPRAPTRTVSMRSVGSISRGRGQVTETAVGAGQSDGGHAAACPYAG
jgi:hypothetical protein